MTWFKSKDGYWCRRMRSRRGHFYIMKTNCRWDTNPETTTHDWIIKLILFLFCMAILGGVLVNGY